MYSVIVNQFIPLFVAVFILTWLFIPSWIKMAKRANLVGKDIHKLQPKEVAEMGGITVLLTFIIGVMGYIAMRVFFLQANTNITEILALLAAILIAGMVGIIDDILGWKIGLRQWQKPLLTLLVAAPIMAINAGSNIMTIPFIGQVSLGLLYPLIIIPTIIAVGTNGFNMLAGYNGLEAGQGIIILATLSYLSYIHNLAWLSVIALIMVFALLGFLIFNKYPAKIFPGDTFTYSVGALIAIIAILANMEKAFLILFIPYIIEFFLKLRGKFQKESFAIVKEDNTLVPRHNKNYGLENLTVRILNKLNIKTTERKVVYTLHAFQLVCVAAAILI